MMRNQEDRSLMQATFAGGCFWCMQTIFENARGVRQVVVGYMGGHKADPSYDDVASGATGHREVVNVMFDPDHISYLKLLDIFFHNIDPTDDYGQFIDKGSQYCSEIFYHNIDQQKLAIWAKEQLQGSGIFSRDIVTQISKAQVFYPAESIHQGYSKKNPAGYERYHKNSGRQCFLTEAWKGKNWHLASDQS